MASLRTSVIASKVSTGAKTPFRTWMSGGLEIKSLVTDNRLKLKGSGMPKIVVSPRLIRLTAGLYREDKASVDMRIRR